MSPLLRRRNLVIGLIAVLLLSIGGGWVIVEHGQHKPDETETPIRPSPQLVPPLQTQVPAPESDAWSPSREAALARAIAAVGQVMDGRLKSLPALDADAIAQIEFAAVLLAGSPRQTAPGLPQRVGDGGSMKVEPDPEGTTPIAPLPAPRDAGAVVIDGHLVPRQLDGRGRQPIPIHGDSDKIISEADAWIAIPYDPALAKGEPLTINNRSGGRYGIKLEADDYSEVRLNGGLVVPGRFYELNGTIEIRSTVPVGVTIRPTMVLHGIFSAPIKPPQANG